LLINLQLILDVTEAYERRYRLRILFQIDTSKHEHLFKFVRIGFAPATYYLRSAYEDKNKEMIGVEKTLFLY